jgi:hypothetical protein
MVTPIEVLDTAVKIGLGALISGAAAYLIATLNHRKDIEKAHAYRRRELLEGVAEQIENFTYLTLKYWALTGEQADYLRSNTQPPELRLAEWRRVREELTDAFRELTSAEAKLLLLGEGEAQMLLRDYGNCVTEFRSETFDGGKTLSQSDVKERRVKILSKREALFHSLSAVYKQ